MTQQVQTPALMPDDLSSTLGIHTKVRREPTVQGCRLASIHSSNTTDKYLFKRGRILAHYSQGQCGTHNVFRISIY